MANKNHRSIEIKEIKAGFEILHKHEYKFHKTIEIKEIKEGFEILVKDEYEESDDDDEDEYSYDDYDIEDEDEEIKEEMTPPKVTTWVGEDGKTVKGLVVVIKHDWSVLGKRKTPPSAFDHDCVICKNPFTIADNHRVCCLPCGHMYGMSCINSLLQLSQSSGRCPTCNTLCTLKDVRLLYPALTNSNLKIKASTKHFPFTKEALRDFKHYALKRRADALKLRTATLERKTVVVDHMLDALKRKMDETLRRRALWQQRSQSKSPDEVLEHQIDTLQQSLNALEQQADAFGCRADALRRRADILKWRAKACKASMNYFVQRYNEHVRGV